MKRKKLVSLLMVGILTLSMLGCGGTAATTDGTEVNEKAAASADASSDEKIKLTFWHIWPDAIMNEMVEKYVTQFEEEHPNVTIEAIATQEVEYQKNKLKVAAATGSQGDIFSCWGGGYAKPYIDAGIVLPLDEYLEKNGTKEDLLEGTLTYATYDEKIYGIPLKQWAGVLFCNEEIFKENNLEIPTTWAEMVAVVKAFREKDITPMVLGGKEGWHIGMIQNALAVRTAGADYMNEALAGKASLNTPEIAKSAELLVELVEAGAFPDGTMGLSADEAQEEFYQGLVPMFFGGSWVASACDSPENEIQGKIKAVAMPTVEGAKGGINSFSGGAIDMMMVNSNTKYPDLAYEFAEGITRYMSEEFYKLGDSLPAWKLNVDEAEASPTLRQVEALIQNADGYVLAWDTFLEGEVIETHYELLQGLIAGTVTPEQFSAGMQEAQEKK